MAGANRSDRQGSAMIDPHQNQARPGPTPLEVSGVRARCAGMMLALSIAALGCHPAADSEPEPRTAPPRMNLVLILVDTLRADHLGAYGYGRATSPSLDAFARANHLFLEHRSQAPCTFPSVNSLLTSQHPARFFPQTDGDFGIPERFVPLAEVLHREGYRTAAVSASTIVRKTPTAVNRVGGFDRGFDSFDETCQRDTAACVNRRAIESISSEPFFLYLHYMEPHGPYSPPKEHVRRFSGGYRGRDWVAAGDPNPVADMIYKASGDVGFTDAELQHFIDLYDDEILYFDSQFQNLIDALAERGHGDDTIVVVTSDHGESFLEHGEIKHCRSLHESQIKTPLIMRIPGTRGGNVIRVDTQNLDIVPTLLAVLGIAAPDTEAAGRNLEPLLEGSTQSLGPSFGAWRHERSLTDGRFKLLYDIERQGHRLHDLRADPGETRDFGREHPEIVSRLSRVLEEQMLDAEPNRARSLQISIDSVEQLKRLGYLE